MKKLFYDPHTVRRGSSSRVHAPGLGFESRHSNICASCVAPLLMDYTPPFISATRRDCASCVRILTLALAPRIGRRPRPNWPKAGRLWLFN
jgi:hypothetical protein